MFDRVELLWTEHDRSCPQLTAETDGAVIVSVNVGELDDEPAGEAAMVIVYVPGGTIPVVEMVRVEVAPVEVGMILGEEKLRVPQGLVPELTWHTIG
jgi:hypothetical protein